MKATEATLEIFVSELALGLPWTGCPQRASNAFRHENPRVPCLLCTPELMLSAKPTAGSSVFSIRTSLFPFIRPFLTRARLAGLMSHDPN